MADNILPGKRKRAYNIIKLFELNTSLVLNHSKFLQLDNEPERIPLNMIHGALSNIHLYLHFWGQWEGSVGVTKTVLLQVGINVEVKLLVIHQKQPLLNEKN